MSDGCCGSTSAKVASIILVIIGIITIIPATVWTALTDIQYVRIPTLVGGVMFVAEGVFGLIFAYNARNRCWVVIVSVVSVIMVMVSVVLIAGSTLLVAAHLILISVDVDNVDDNTVFLWIGLFIILVSLISLWTSIVLIASSCTSRRSNMGSAAAAPI